MAAKITRLIGTLTVLVALSACGGSERPEPGAAGPIRIRIEHSAFIPATLEIPARSSVEFVIVNDDPIDHEFIIGDAEVQQVHEEGTETRHDLRPGEITVPAEETVQTTYTFEEPGELIFGCHVPGHYEYGMRGVIEIT